MMKAIRVVTFASLATAFVIPATEITGEQLFHWETVQLTQAMLINLTNMSPSDIELFDFPKPSTSPAATISECKVFPGDANWPSDVSWKVLNTVTGDALIRTVPLAAPCYLEWPEYNAAECASITSQWIDPHLQ